MRRERSGNMNNGMQRVRPWQRPFSTIVAVLFTALLVGSFIVLFNRAHQSRTSSDNKTQQQVVTKAPTTVPTVSVQNAGSISSIHMLDATTGWALTDHAVLRTTDGGTYWQDVTPPHATPASINGAALAVLDASTAWVATVRPAGTTLLVFRTSDAGQTWQQTIVKANGNTAGAQITFINAKDGWMLVGLGAGAGSEAVAIYRTTDGGQTWTKASSTNPPVETTPGGLPLGGDKNGLSFLNSSTGWATGTEPSNTPWLYVTHDGGQTWQHQALQLPPNQASAELSITPPTFFNATDGILPVNGLSAGSAVVGASDIYITHDGGATWNSTSLLAANASSADFTDINHGWVTDGANLYMTSDGGQHWTKILSVTNNMPKFQSLDFVSSEVGLAIGYTDSGAMFLLKTVDGGYTWTHVRYIVYKVV